MQKLCVEFESMLVENVVVLHSGMYCFTLLVIHKLENRIDTLLDEYQLRDAKGLEIMNENFNAYI